MDHNKNALDCLEAENNAKYIPTSCRLLDNALGQGFRLGTLSEIVGSGKTQLCLQLAMNTVMPEPPGLINGEVIFISTKHNLMPERLNRLADHCVEAWNTSKEAQEISLKTKFKFTRDEVLKKIYSLRVLNLAELISSVYKAKKFIESKGIYNNVRLIVVDCFASFLLDETPTDRIAFMYEMLHILGEIAKKQNCAVVVTNNMTTVITTDMSLMSLFQTQAFKPALGDAFHYRIQQRIILSKSEYDSQVVIAHVQKNVVDGPSLLKFKITQNGIEDV